MIDINEKYMKRCYELAISAGKKGFDTGERSSHPSVTKRYV